MYFSGPHEGAHRSLAARRIVELINECGNQELDVIVKSDQEPAVKFLIDDVLRHRTSAKTIVEESPKRSSGSNSVVERAIQTAEGFVRS